MNLVFCLEDNFGLEAIKTLLKKKIKLSLVICLYKNPYTHISIKKFCENKKIKFLLLRKKILKSNFFFLYNITKVQPDVLVTCHFNYIIPKQILDIPKLGSINLHPSLLPKYRGQSPQHWSILNNDKYYGLSVHFMKSKVDTGNILFQKKILLPKKIYISDLQLKLKEYYALSIYKSIILLKNGFKGIKQNNKNKSYKGKIKINDFKIKNKDTINKAYRKIRAFSKPYMGAKYKNFIIWRAEKTNLKFKKNGIFKKKDKVYIALKNKSLIVKNYNETRVDKKRNFKDY